MKRIITLTFWMAVIAVGLGAQSPKIAVLDCTIPKGFDNSVIIPITENIMEEIVSSGKYTVLDRNNISAIFKEKEFQLSGEVTDKDIAAAGQLLGANFVVVSKMQQVGDTYFLTSKMINITTGAIAAQASFSQEGKLTVLLSMAHTVGWSLATGEKIVTQPNGANTKPVNPAVAGPVAQVAGGSASGMMVQRFTRPTAPLDLTKGTKYYTQVALHPDGRRRTLSAVNYLDDGFIPPGTQIEVVAADRNTLKFKLMTGKETYVYQDHKQGKEDFKVHLARYFAADWNPAVINGLSKLDQDGIAAGKASVGMSRDGVILALGFPPRAENPDINAARWLYWNSRTNRVAINFDAKGLVSLIKN